MPKTKISEYSATANSNTDVASINIDEGCAPSGINNAIRAIMGHLKDFQSGTSNDPFTVGSSGSLTLSYGTANGVAYLNGSKVLTTGSALVFDGSNLGLGVTPSGNYQIQTPVNYNGGAKGFNISSLAGGTSGNGVPYVGYNFRTTGTADSYTYNTADYASAIRFYDGIQFKIAASGTAGNAITFTQAMTLDASGNFFVGYTSPYTVSGGGTNKGTFGYDQAGRTQIVVSNQTNNAASGAAIVLGSYGADWIIESGSVAKNSTSLTFAFGTSEKARIDSGGKLLLGVTSGTGLSNGDFAMGNGNHIRFRNAANSAYISAFEFTSANGLNIGTGGSLSTITFGISGIGEAGRFDTSGNLLVGTTNPGTIGSSSGFAAYSDGSISAAYTSNRSIFARRSTDGSVIEFRRDSTAVGSISVTTTATAYNTSSDYRLKNSITPMTGALAKVAALKPVTYKWNADGSDGEGFIAHELAEVVPQCVTGEKDAMDAEGKPIYQGIDTSFLVATLTAAIQEQQSIIQSLTARITALEGA